MSNHDTILVRAQITPTFSVCQFVSENATALVSAARILGGEQAAKRTERLTEEVAQGAPLNRRLRAELVTLHRLLSLEGVDNFGSVEAACFAEIDPASPVVEDICLVSDTLLGHLTALALVETCDPVWRPVLETAA